MSLQLVESELTGAALFTAAGEVVQPLRGALWEASPDGARQLLPHNQPYVGHAATGAKAVGSAGFEWRTSARPRPGDDAEQSQHRSGGVDPQDFLSRVDLLGALGMTVMVSNHTRFDEVTSYLRKSTQNCIAMAVGIPTLREIFMEQYYAELPGGILEGMGRLFQGNVKLLVYPTRELAEGPVETVESLDVDPRQRSLYQYLLDRGGIEAIQEFDSTQLHIRPQEVLSKLQSGDPAWETMVPPEVAG